MKILITGSSGFLGTHSVQHFKRLGHQVIGVDLSPSPSTDIVDDVRKYITESSEHFDLLLHFAAEVGGRKNIETNYLQMIKNIELDCVVFEWAIKHVSHLLYPSSSAVYPVTEQTQLHSKLHENLVDFDNNCIGVSDHLYGWYKLTAERMLWQIHQSTDLQIHVLRPFSGYGPGQDMAYPMPNLIHIVKTSPDKLQVWGNGNQTRDWVHVSDILRTIEWCINDPARFRTLNIGTGIATSFKELVKLIYHIVYQSECPEIKTLSHCPTGVQHRTADIALQTDLNILPLINLESGIKTLI